jgi:geranylgeranyl reductase family protein
MHDVIVIGGGPAGNRTAALLAKDREVLVIEDHGTPGTPVQCAGLVSDEVIGLSGVRPEILNRLYGANIIFPNGGRIAVRSKGHKAVLIDRHELDSLMAQKAEEAGAEHSYSTRYKGHKISGDTVHVATDKGGFASAVIVGADGHNSSTAKTVPDNRPREFVKGIQADIRHRMDDPGMVNIRIGSETAPGFFSWEIPFGEMTRVGLCVSSDSAPPSEYFKPLLKKAKLEDREIVSRYCGKIPIGGQRRTYAERMLLVGDAACHVKPISGGGLQPALRSSFAAAETICEAFDENDFSESFLSVYEKRWRRDVGKELKRGYRLRKMYTAMDDEEFNRVHRIIDKKKITEKLNEGDIDHPSDLLFRMLMHPVTMLRLAPLMIRTMFRG